VLAAIAGLADFLGNRLVRAQVLALAASDGAFLRAACAIPTG
jgi:hypothetical protein